jgi:threonine dehydratase
MITIQDVERARSRIKDSIYVSPCAHTETFSQLVGNKVFLKLENLQMTGSFKERGALNKILTLTDEEKRRGVLCASAGNHAQGVAYHAARNGIRATIVMPTATPLVKVTRTRDFGAEVVLHGSSYDEAFEEAWRRREAEGLTFIHAFDDDAVMAGQGTIGLELIEQNPYLDVVVVPVGGGGMVSGIAVAMKETNPRIQIFGVQTARLPSMKRAVSEHAPTALPAAGTIADGIAVRKAGARTLPVVEKYVDDIVLVDEEEIANAILWLLEREKTVAEGAGAAAVAAVMQGKIPVRGKKCALIIGGGNIDVNLLSRIIERGLVKDGRLVRLRIRIPDHPGALHRLTGKIAGVRANILEVIHNRAFSRVDLGETAVDVTLETRGAGHIDELTSVLANEGYEHERLVV